MDVSAGPRLYYTDDGDGRPVLFIHGLGSAGSDWAWLASGLAADYRTVAADWRGHGQSSRVDGKYTTDDIAADHAELIRRLGMERPIVVAHSFGAFPAIRLATDYADLVGALVLIDPAIGRPDDGAETLTAAVASAPHAGMLRVFDGFYVPATPDWLRWWHRRQLLATGEDVLSATVAGAYLGPRALGRRSVGEAELPKVTAPRLVVYAGFNTERYEWDRALPHRPDDHLECWPGHGHFLYQEDPARFAQLMRTWLSSLSAPDRGDSAS
jgi:pimeloyl-ACP methyl ester carboxylesterase